MSRDEIAEQAAALLRQGESARAIELLVAQKTLSVRAADYLCDAYFQQREWDKALALLRAMLQHGQAHPYRNRLEAKILNNMGRHTEALAVAEKLLAEHGDDIDC